MRITAAICTRNRAAKLDRTLESFAKLAIPDGVEWELLIVDNGSSDDTVTVIERHARKLPIRCLHEPRAGLSNARNCAVDAATGEIVLWADDDVTPDSDWLAEYAAAAARHPDAGVFGGSVVASFESPPPRWLAAEWSRVADAYAVRDALDEDVTMHPRRMPAGANFGVRSQVQRRFRYDPRVGRQPGSMIGGEETQVIRRILLASHRGVWVPNARVRHRISAMRLTERHLRDVYFGQGQQLVVFLGRDALQTTRHLLARALRAELRFQVLRRTAKAGVWLDALQTAGHRWGELHQTRKMRTGP